MEFEGEANSLLDRVNQPSDLRNFSDDDLCKLASELRDETISIVSETGGHLGSSLGVVELTVALHAVFNTPFDKLIWDVGHQCYPHKIITGRRKQMRTLRQKMVYLVLQSALKVNTIPLVRHTHRPQSPQH